MGPLSRSVSQPQVYENPNTPQSTSQQRFDSKVNHTLLTFPPLPPPINWDSSRVITPGKTCGLKNSQGLNFFTFGKDNKCSIQLFHQGQESQGLISEDGQVTGASVTSKILSQTLRKNEKKGTFIQYDKEHVLQDGADFRVEAKNHRGRVNYEGSHFIDHKYSAENSHYCKKNYFPSLYFYNKYLKEYLVRRCTDYVEIALYTPNPPKIGIKDKVGRKSKEDEYDPIPIGVIFVQIGKNQIQDIYYFPNNDFNYESLKKILKPKKNQVGATITPYFKLKKDFHHFLRPALITDLQDIKDGESRQSEQEEKFFELTDNISLGMSLIECSDLENIISAFSFNVLNQDYIDPGLCLDFDRHSFNPLQDQSPSLEIAFHVLGEFLVHYSLRNALKSEVLSVKSRLVFLNVILDFVESSPDLTNHARDFIANLEEQFTSTLDELDKISNTMNLEELIYLGNTYQNILSPFMTPFCSLEGDEIFDFYNDNEDYFKKLIKILKLIAAKHPIESLKEDNACNFLDLVRIAQKKLNDLLEWETDQEDVKEEYEFLKEIESSSLKLHRKITPTHGSMNVQYKTGINSMTHLRTSADYLEYQLTFPSMPDDVDEDELSNESEEEISDSDSEDERLDSGPCKNGFSDNSDYEIEASESDYDSEGPLIRRRSLREVSDNESDDTPYDTTSNSSDEEDSSD